MHLKLFLIMCSSILLLNCKSIEERDELIPDYYLKCSTNLPDCSLIETLTHSDSNELDGLSKSMTDNQKLNKRLFFQRNDHIKVIKPTKIKCETKNCMLITAKIEKRTRNGAGTLTCLGDPYSTTGSRCIPIEGLYIG